MILFFIVLAIVFSWLVIFTILQFGWLFQEVPKNIAKAHVLQKFLNVLVVFTLPFWVYVTFMGFATDFVLKNAASSSADMGRVIRSLFFLKYFYPVSVFTGFVFFRAGWKDNNSFKMNLSSDP